MIKLIENDHYYLFKDDPVRPHLSENFRTSPGRDNFVLLNTQDSVLAALCCAYVNEVPITESELDKFSQQACQDGQQGDIAVFYTVWSYEKGAGRTIIFNAVDMIKKERPWVKRFVTLSPLTSMAERFHIRNGATLLNRGNECQNFEYSL